MANNFENKNQVPPEYSANFKKDIISFIIDTAVPKILENCAKKDSIDERDIAAEVRPMIDGYEKSSVVKKILYIKGYEDWIRFRDEVTDIVSRYARNKKEAGSSVLKSDVGIEMQKNEVSIDSPPLKSKDLKQKKLF